MQPTRVPAAVVATAMLFAMQRDFAQAAPLWREAVALSSSPTTAIVVLRAAVDGFLRTGDLPQAWDAMQQLLTQSDAIAAEPLLETGQVAESQSAVDGSGLDGLGMDGLVVDGSDAQVALAPTRWIRGRLAELFAKATPPLRVELDAFAARASAVALADAPSGGIPRDRMTRLRQFIERFGSHDRALEARRQLAEVLGEAIEAKGAGDDRWGLVVERDFVLLDLARIGKPSDREYAAAVLAGIRDGFAGPAERTAGGEAGGVNAAGAEDAAWPVGRVVQRRGAVVRNAAVRQDVDDVRFVRSRLTNVPVTDSVGSFLPGLELAFDQHQQSGIIATDGYGRPIGDPFAIKSLPDGARIVPMFQPGGIDQATVIGRVVYIRAGAGVAAFEMGAAGGARQGNQRNRPLWMLADKTDPTGEARAVGFVMNIGGGKAARHGTIAPNIALGARVSEPRQADGGGRRTSAPDWVVRSTGVAIMADRSLRVHDPLTGRLLWERQRLPAVGELIGDDDFLCICPPGGRGAVLLSMADGRVVRTLDLPPSERRLLTSGRHILAVQPIDGVADRKAAGGIESSDAGGARRVRLDRIDPLDGQRQPLGTYHGESRASTAGDGRVAVVEPSGDLSLIDVDAGRVVFRTRLSDMPAGLEHLQVLSWNGSYLVLVGRGETPEEQRQLERIGAIGPLPGMPGREMPQVVTGSLWAVDGVSGDMLWPVPATILRHSLQSHGGSQLPVLLFAVLAPLPVSPNASGSACFASTSGRARRSMPTTASMAARSRGRI
jgi:hypothetical protein